MLFACAGICVGKELKVQRRQVYPGNMSINQGTPLPAHYTVAARSFSESHSWTVQPSCAVVPIPIQVCPSANLLQLDCVTMHCDWLHVNGCNGVLLVDLFDSTCVFITYQWKSCRSSLSSAFSLAKSKFPRALPELPFCRKEDQHPGQAMVRATHRNVFPRAY